MNRVNGIVAFILSLAVLVVASCGGGGGTVASGGSGGIGGTGITSGTITGFGSIFVNGVEFETSSSSFSVDDDDLVGSDRDLFSVGQVVTIEGTVNADGVTGTATRVIFDDELEGPIAAAPVLDADGSNKTFTVFGTTVIVNGTTTVLDGVSFAALAQNDVVEVSGFVDAAGDLHATHLEKKGVLNLGVTEVEIKGTIVNSNGTSQFDIQGTGITVNFDGTTDVSDLPGGVPNNGLFVEVEGVLATASTITASRIEEEDEGFGDNVAEISIEGIVTDFVSIANFKVAGQSVNGSGATLSPATLAVANGVEVEVEGAIVDGTLVADEIEGRGGDTKVHAAVGAINVVAGTITLDVTNGSVTVLVDVQTEMEDNVADLEPFSLNDINVGDFLKVEGFETTGNQVAASKIKRDSADDLLVQALTDTFNNACGVGDSVTVLGVPFSTVGASFENAADAGISCADFYTALNLDPNEIVKIVDTTGDGVANEVEFED